MTRGQRVIVVVTLLVLAVALHVALFDWSYQQPWQPPLFAGQPLFTGVFCDPLLQQGQCLAIWYDYAVANNRLAAILLGIISPIVLLSAAGYLAAALRRK